MVAAFRHGPGKDRLRAEGRLLEEFADPAGPMGLAYHKEMEDFSCGGRLSRVSLLFARCHSVFDVFAAANSVSLRLDAYATMLIPAGVSFRQ